MDESFSGLVFTRGTDSEDTGCVSVSVRVCECEGVCVCVTTPYLKIKSFHLKLSTSARNEVFCLHF